MKIRISLTSEQADKLLGAFNRNELVDHGIVNVKDLSRGIVVSQANRDTEEPWSYDRVRWNDQLEPEKWQDFLRTYKEGDVVAGRIFSVGIDCAQVNIGVMAFLIAENDVLGCSISDFENCIHETLEFEICMIGIDNRCVIVTHGKPIEYQRPEWKTKLLTEIAPGQFRTGVVKSITCYGAIVDLGGIDGLLETQNIGWTALGHPSEIMDVGQPIEVCILNVDMEKERISLSLKHKTLFP